MNIIGNVIRKVDIITLIYIQFLQLISLHGHFKSVFDSVMSLLTVLIDVTSRHFYIG